MQRTHRRKDYCPAGNYSGSVAAASQEPIIIGKPQTAMFEQAMEIMGTKPLETLCIGDRLERMFGGQNAGCLTALVLEGQLFAQAQARQPQPTIIAKDLSSLLYD